MAFRLESQAEPIPGYKLLERLGGGGFGEVWKVEAPGGLLKAIKFVYGDLQTGDQDRVRAEQELKSLSRVKSVRHPYILSLERFDIVNGQLLIVMELADRNLWDRFRACRLQGLPGIPREELLRYLSESAEALDLMNSEYQLQHLDIKPQNIFLVHNHIKVADFGLVKDLEGRVASVTGGVTPLYAAPEMFDGWISRYCDQYSLAMVYQELLTGNRPFVGTNVHQLVMQHVQGKPNLEPLPYQERAIVGRALSKRPEDRFPTCGDFVHALLAAGTVNPAASVLSRPPTPVPDGGVDEGPDRLQTPPPSDRTVSGSRLIARNGHEGLNGHAGARAEPVQAPPERTGDGELFPALVIGLGGMGLKVLRHLHAQLEENFGTREELPHIRLLYLDTDPEAPQAAAAALPAREVFLAKLNRASHYLKPCDGRLRVDGWFHTSLLYRIQRHQVTGGVRALGRLAFVDNYRSIAARLRAELEACLHPAHLEAATHHTGLGMRSNRPRIYVAAGLTGGTGGGMFLDVAYVVRDILRRLGYVQPDLVGLLLLPPPTDNPGRRMGMGNAFAALTELNHFSSADTTFTARYDEREAPLRDAEAPFCRTILMPLPAGDGPVVRPVSAEVSELVFRELTTPLGRAAESHREEATAGVAPSQRRLLCQSFGLYRFSWPRRVLLQRAGRRLCRRLVERWSCRQGPADEVADRWADEQWKTHGLGADALMARLQAMGDRAVGKAPEAAFTEVTDPLKPRGWWKRRVDPDRAAEAVGKLEALLGQPSPSAVLASPGILDEAIRHEAEAAAADWKQRVTRLIAPLIDQPGFRVAGAEKAARRLTALAQEAIAAHESLCQELTAKAAAAHERLQFLRPMVREIFTGGRRTAPLRHEFLDLLRRYPKWRYQALVLKAVGSVYTATCEVLSDRLRELALCRTRLRELFDHLELREAERPAGSWSEESALYPGGCRNLEEAVDQFADGFAPADLDALDERLQAMIRQHFRGLAHVCSTTHLMEKLAGSMVEEAVAFAGPRLAGEDVVKMFLGRHPSREEAHDALAAAFDEAAPRLGRSDSSGLTEVAILAAPPGPHEAELRELARQGIPDADLIPAASTDDIVFYREETQLLLAQLEQLGPQGREAYQLMSASENFTPHSRNDVPDWQAAAPASS